MKLDNGICACISKCMTFPEELFPCNSIHGASLIGKNGRVLVSGRNHYRTHCSYASMWKDNNAKMNPKLSCSFHAEVEVIRQYSALMTRGTRKCKLHGPQQQL
jgi:hypothetical protein